MTGPNPAPGDGLGGTGCRALPGKSTSEQRGASLRCLEVRSVQVGHGDSLLMEQPWCMSLFLYRVESKDQRKHLKGGGKGLLQLQWVIVGLGMGLR